MESLSYSITFAGNTYQIYLDRNVTHLFNSKTAAKRYVSKYKHIVHDNVLLIGNLSSQVHNVKVFYNPFLPSEVSRKYKYFHENFEDAYYNIYHNYYDNSSVKWSKIRVSFDFLLDMIILLRSYGQRHKRVVLLNQIYPIQKMYLLVVKSYNEDIRGLHHVNTSYRGRLLNLNDQYENDKNTGFSQKSS